MSSPRQRCSASSAIRCSVLLSLSRASLGTESKSGIFSSIVAGTSPATAARRHSVSSDASSATPESAAIFSSSSILHVLVAMVVSCWLGQCVVSARMMPGRSVPRRCARVGSRAQGAGRRGLAEVAHKRRDACEIGAIEFPRKTVRRRKLLDNRCVVNAFHKRRDACAQPPPGPAPCAPASHACTAEALACRASFERSRAKCTPRCRSNRHLLT